ncbi:MAG: hypothetical protein E7393_01225 [Ruminococcaceae bacterium]|nr:hypothetical protein [Oscillospiraceae bacterium]
MSLFYKIGGLVIQTEDNFNDFAKYHLSNYQTESTEHPDICIQTHMNCENIPLPEGTPIAEINKRFWLKTKNNGYAFYDRVEEFSDKVLNALVADSEFRNIEVWHCPTFLLNIEEDYRAYYIIQKILRFALLMHNGLIVHASSLAYQNQGLLFSAPSGTGKSTHTNLWLQHAPGTIIVNDDMPIIRIENQIPYLYGAPWSGKNSIHQNIRVPLSAFVFLERDVTCSLTPMDTMEAVWRLFDAIRKPAIPDLAEKSLDIVARLISTVPAYLLRCDMSKEAVETAMTALQ